MKPLHRIISISFFILIFSTASCQKTQSENNTDNMVLFASGVSNPVYITNAGDSRLFVVDQAGYIRILDSAGKMYTQPYLDIRSRVTFGGERGLLGLAFHPEYKTNGFFYVNYVGPGDITNISRFKVNSANPEIADPTSELKIMTITQPFSNHNGGTLCFGPDGYLYIGMGDVSSAHLAKIPMDNFMLPEEEAERYIVSLEIPRESMTATFCPVLK